MKRLMIVVLLVIATGCEPNGLREDVYVRGELRHTGVSTIIGSHSLMVFEKDGSRYYYKDNWEVVPSGKGNRSVVEESR